MRIQTPGSLLSYFSPQGQLSSCECLLSSKDLGLPGTGLGCFAVCVNFENLGFKSHPCGSDEPYPLNVWKPVEPRQCFLQSVATQ